MNRSAQHHRFSFCHVICSQLPIAGTPDNSNLSLFPLKVRVIGIRLYLYFQKHLKVQSEFKLVHFIDIKGFRCLTFFQF